MFNIMDELAGRGIKTIAILASRKNMEERLAKSGENIEYIFAPFNSMRIRFENCSRKNYCRYFINKLKNKHQAVKLARILRNKNIDIVHINGLDSEIGALIARKLNVPYVWHIRQFLDEDFSMKLYAQKKTYRLVKKSAAVIGISKAVQEKYEKELKIPMMLIYNGIPIERYQIKKERILYGETVKILLAGRIIPYKGQMTAVKAIGILVKSGINTVKLTLVGETGRTGFLRQLKDYINENGLEDNVAIMDHADNLRELRTEHDICLVCSTKEAFGRVTIEGMLSSQLVIGANSGGTAEIIQHGDNGLLYSPGDENDLYQKLIYTLTHKDEMNRIARKGYKHACEKYSIKRVADELLSVYNIITGKRG